jgi:hypothetical protein
VLYRPALIPVRVRHAEDRIGDPAFHAQNSYAIVMRTLARFERALGRRVSWSFAGHQLHVAPHAFADANAFYSRDDWGLFFGYFENEARQKVFTCLSHDVVAHETTHALLDGLRERYTYPSSPDQAAFHEGFADVVALLSIYSLDGVVEKLIDATAPRRDPLFVETRWLTRDNLLKTALFGLGEEMDPRRNALRRSVAIEPDKRLVDQEEFQEPHRRGELFVAAMLNAFLKIWLHRLKELGDGSETRLLRSKVCEEGQAAADHLLTMAIRALDYAPVTDLLFGDYWSALLTADLEVQPDDSRYHYREAIFDTFTDYGIAPAPTRGGIGGVPGCWEPPQVVLDYSRTHLESLRQDRDEIFRFLWENRKGLGLFEDAYTQVLSVRPCLRLSTEGFPLRETVAEYYQVLNPTAREARRFGIKIPKGMSGQTKLRLYGGGALIFNDYGRLKYHVRGKVLNAKRQSARLQYLWDTRYFETREQVERPFAYMHRFRQLGQRPLLAERKEAHGGFF